MLRGWRDRRHAHVRRVSRRAERLIRSGRLAEAGGLLPQLPFRPALRLLASLDAAGWAPAAPVGPVFDRVRPAARLAAEATAPLLSGRPQRLGTVADGASVVALSFAPDAPTLAVATYAHGLEVWGVRPLEMIRRYDPPDAERGPWGPAPPAMLRVEYSPTLWLQRAVALPRGRVLVTAGRSTGPYVDLYLAEGDDLLGEARLEQDSIALVPLPDRVLAVTNRGSVWVRADGGAVYQGLPLDLDRDTAPLWGVVASADGRRVATYSHQNASVHETSSGRALARTGPLPGMARGETVTFTIPATADLTFTLAQSAGRIGSVCFQPGGDGLIAGTIDGEVRLLGLDFSHQSQLLPHTQFATVLAAPAGKAVATIKDAMVRVYRWPERDPIELRPGSNDPRGTVVFSPRGWLLAVAPDQSALSAPQPRRAGRGGSDDQSACRIAVWDLTPWVLAPIIERELDTIDADDLTTIREALAAADIYRAGEATTLALDALLALGELTLGSSSARSA